MDGIVVAVSRNCAHTFSKPTQASIRVVPGLGVEGDAHFGTTVQHLSRIAGDPIRVELPPLPHRTLQRV